MNTHESPQSNGDKPLALKYDFDLDIATAHSRLSTKWKNRAWRWSELLRRCKDVKRTGETIAEYRRMTPQEQSNIKDVGGFVGGYLANGSRKTSNVIHRSIATLDIDRATPDVWDDFTLQFDCAAAVYSTHKHTKESPRLRLLLPADRPMTAMEYEPVCRYWADVIGIDMVDPASYRVAQLMYWPSASKDGDFVFDFLDGKPFSVDKVLATYRDVKDASQWPLSSREAEVVVRDMRKAGDPTEKPGLIGAFCRAYTIEDAIELLLTDVYEKTAQDGRYTYRKGSVAGGCVTYDHKYAYSHHDTDPAGRQLCNAFDLVRIHKFGLLDEGSRASDVTLLPSYQKMMEFAGTDKKTCLLMAKERQASAADDFAAIPAIGDVEDPAHGSDDWMGELEYDKKGNVKSTPRNLKMIMLNDGAFAAVRYDLFSQRDVIVVAGNPFTGTHGPEEVDDTSLARMCGYLSENYGINLSINSLVDKMLKLTAPERSFHAVKDFIMKEKWDGVPRVDTLLIDYLGAEDTPLNRAITRKWMAGAVGRAIDTDPDDHEGIKFDYCLVLFGKQGTGKSTFAETLANRWRGSISFNDPKKEQYETLQKSWITEIPELKGASSADSDMVKDLISSRSDNFRAAYARQWNKNPRHSILIGSTNNEYFLKDVSGNRRYWVVKVTGGEGVRNWRDRLKSLVGQIWAEAYLIYKSGEPLMLSEEMEQQARSYAEKFNTIMGDPLRDYLAEWLEIPLPPDWATYDPARRKAYYKNYDPLDPQGSIERRRVAIHEIITTCPYPGIIKHSPQRIGAMLESLGWEKEDKRQKLGITFGGSQCKRKVSTFYSKLQSESKSDI